VAAGSPSHSAADGQVTEPPVVHPSVHSSRAARQEGGPVPDPGCGARQAVKALCCVQTCLASTQARTASVTRQLADSRQAAGRGRQ